jgi:O-antigen/teichoic acid export membrane protein
MRIKSFLKNKAAENAVWIVGAKAAQAVLSLIIGMLTARYLGPSNYGIVNYAASLVAFVAPIMNLGISSILVQELVQNDNDEAILGSTIVLNLCSSVLCMIGVTAFASLANSGEPDTIIVCLLYSTLLVFQAFGAFEYWFQANLKSKYSSIVSLFAYIVVSTYKTILLITGRSVYWFAVSNSLDYCIIGFALFYLYKKQTQRKLRFSITIAKRLLSKSKYYIISSMMVTVFAQTDRIMLKTMLNSESVGYYSAALTCAGLTSFVFSAIITSFRPVIFESQMCSNDIFERNMKRLYSIIIYLSLAQSIVISVFARQIIVIIYGEQYLSAVSALQIVVWFTTFSYLGSVRNIWILANNKQKYLWIINLSGAVFNVVLNRILIPLWGINGAAIASLITQVFTNIFVGYLIKEIIPNNVLMVQSLHPKYIIDLIKRV